MNITIRRYNPGDFRVFLDDAQLTRFHATSDPSVSVAELLRLAATAMDERLEDDTRCVPVFLAHLGTVDHKIHNNPCGRMPVNNPKCYMHARRIRENNP